ncbi:hypothetical protein EDC04DRAFT_2888439 [Pisolithus marmoratus]|nr:hypothetical protein EDC04DRAFT_2888439 [Pisolithus marmoratus]
MLKELGEQLNTVHVPTNGQLVTPWLLTAHWNEWAKWFKKPMEELCALVSLPWPSLPDKEHYRTLPESIRSYFEEAVMLIDTTDNLVLQRLNLPDPAKEDLQHAISQALAPKHIEAGANMEILRLEDMLQEDGIDQSQIVHQINVILLEVWTAPWSKNKFHIVLQSHRVMSSPPHSEP